jgi:hypothetical protein
VPQYFFRLHDGTDLIDDKEGRQLDGQAAVVAQALIEARGILGAEALEGRIALGQRIDVLDSAGLLVYRLDFIDAATLELPSQLC